MELSIQNYGKLPKGDAFGVINKDSKVLPNSIEITSFIPSYSDSKLSLDLKLSRFVGNMEVIAPLANDVSDKVSLTFTLPGRYSQVNENTKFEIIGIPNSYSSKKKLVVEILKNAGKSVFDEINQKMRKMTGDDED
ncbi:MAG: hypothetical protein HRT47_03240 [Candidatus Caenarcaniphilales bacterium]|nr:hypothetical protein [Candidatus Caenarcaniphilales bacterium]